MKRRRGFFFDRDGTLIADACYLDNAAGVELLPGAIAALQIARQHGQLFLFSNQSGVGRGYYGWEEVQAINDRMHELIGMGNTLFAAICMAAEAPQLPQVYRKPSPRFILESIAQFNLDPAECWMFGDRLTDLQAGLRAGIRSALVTNGRPPDHGSELAAYVRQHAIPVAERLDECMELVGYRR